MKSMVLILLLVFPLAAQVTSIRVVDSFSDPNGGSTNATCTLNGFSSAFTRVTAGVIDWTVLPLVAPSLYTIVCSWTTLSVTTTEYWRPLGSNGSTQTLVQVRIAGYAGPTGNTTATPPLLKTGNDLSCPTCAVTTGTYNNPSWVTGLAWAKISNVSLLISQLSATGTASSTTFLRGDNVWAAPPGGLADPGANGVMKRTSLGVTAAAVIGTDYVVPAGNVATATALAANGANCSAGQAPLGVDASGAAEGCFVIAAGAATPWPMTITSSTVLTIGVGTARVNQSFYSTVSTTVTVTAGASGTVLGYLTPAGVINILPQTGITVTCASPCVVLTAVASPTFPVPSIPIFSASVVSVTWDAVTQLGALANETAVGVGTGMSEAVVSGVRVFSATATPGILGTCAVTGGIMYQNGTANTAKCIAGSTLDDSGNMAAANAAFGTIQTGTVTGLAFGYFGVGTGSVFAFSSDSTWYGTKDAGFSRVAAGVIGVGTGAAGNSAGRLAVDSSTPANAAAACVAKSFWVDANYFYYCVSSGAIKRAAIATW